MLEVAMIKQVAIAAAALVLSSSFAVAGSGGPKYELKRIPMGPRPDNYVLVRVDRPDHAARPYALTGDAQNRPVKQKAARPTPSHPKGTHGPF